MIESANGAAEVYWAGLLGCTIDELRSPGVHISTYQGAYRDAWWLQLERSHILSVPGDLVQRIQDKVGAARPLNEIDLGRIECLLAPQVRRIIGPCFLGYADRDSFRAGALLGARRLDADDLPALHKFADSCPDEWAEAGLNVDRPPIFGCFRQQQLVSAASYEVWGGTIAHIGVVTHPDWRRLGYGRAAAACAGDDALASGLAVQWRALESNTASVALGTSLGCSRWASHYTILLSGNTAETAASQ